MIELIPEDIEISVDSSVVVSTAGNVDVDGIENDITVAFDSNEYSIVGDDMVVLTKYEDAPQWMKDVINGLIDVKTAIAVGDLTQVKNALNAMLSELEVAKNTYELSIISTADVDLRIQTKIETLNSTLGEVYATIVDVAQTYVTPFQASAIALNTLSASLSSDGIIGSTISNLQVAFAGLESTTAQDISYLSSVMQGEIEGNATATQTLRTYVGISEDGGVTGTGLLANVEILQKQNDGVIETTTGTYDVMISPENPDLAQLVITAEPYVTWKAADVTGINTRLAHIGDVYVKYADTANGAKEYIASYKFIRTTVDETSPYATDIDGFTWALVVDQAAQDAYEQALNAFDLADNKRRVFVATPFVPYDIGDLWLVQAGAVIIGTTQGGRVIQAGDMLRCSETKTATGLYENNDWIPADNYRESMDAIQTDLNSWRTGTYATFVTNIQTQVDGKAETFYQNSIPTGRIKSVNVPNNTTLNSYVGDLWKNTFVGTISGYLGDNTEYVYTKTANGSNWNYDWTKMEVPDIVFDTIDTKKSIYSGNFVPVAIAPDIIEINDMWITGSSVVAGYDKESIYVWNGTSWIKPLKYTDDSATVALQTGLANGTATVKLTNAFVGTTPFLTYITNEIDSKVGVYSGETAPVAGQPSGVAANDIYLWFTTASKVLANGTTQVYDITRTYKYSGSVWNEITTDSNITALADLADGKRTVFSGNTVPVGAVARDIWIPSSTNGSYLQGEIYQYSGSAWIVATKYSADLEAVRSNLQSQVDGKVETYYQATVPTGMTSVNNGDYWYCTTDVSTYKKGKVYKYVHATTSWVETADVSRYAFDTADGKASIFTSTNPPTTGYKVNDMLIVIGSFSNGTTMFSDGVVLSSSTTRATGFTASDWVKKINDTEDLYAFVDNTYTPTVTNLQTQVDGKVESWYALSTNDPKVAWTDAETRAKHNGDLWYQTDTKISQYYSSSTNSWNLIDDAKAIEAIQKAATAQATADGVVVSYYAIKQDTAPATSSLWLNKTGTKALKEYTTSWVNVDVKEGDTLTAYDSATKDISVYVYHGTGWITNTENGLVATSEWGVDLNAYLDNKAVGGTSSLVSDITATSNNGLSKAVNSRFAYNSNLVIDGVTYPSGFGLSNSAGTGIGSEFWIDASRLKFTNSNVTGSVAPFTIDADDPQPEITFNGKVSFSNINGANMSGSNLLYNSAPTIGIETKGWQADYNDTGMASSGLLASDDPYRPIGGGGFHQYIPGTPAVGKVFDIRAVAAIPVIGGQFYEGSAYLNPYRCDGRIYVGWRDSTGATITYSMGDIVTQTNTTNVLASWGRSKFIVQAPANAASCYYYIRGTSTGEANPYVFVSMCYFGRAAEGQTVYSNWSDGISASVSSGEVVSAINSGQTTTIDGGKITANSVTANQINVNNLFAQDITYTGVITGGNTAGGGIIQSYNGNMVINLVEGSIYIS